MERSRIHVVQHVLPEHIASAPGMPCVTSHPISTVNRCTDFSCEIFPYRRKHRRGDCCYGGGKREGWAARCSATRSRRLSNCCCWSFVVHRKPAWKLCTTLDLVLGLRMAGCVVRRTGVRDRLRGERMSAAAGKPLPSCTQTQCFRPWRRRPEKRSEPPQGPPA